MIDTEDAAPRWAPVSLVDKDSPNKEEGDETWRLRWQITSQLADTAVFRT